MPLGTHEYGGGVNFALFSRHATRVRLELFDQPADATPARVIDFDPHATAREMCGTSGLRGFVPVSSMPTGWMAPTNPAKAIVSIFTGCSWTPLRRRFRGCRTGILDRLGDTIRLRRSRTWLLRRSTMPQPCRNACPLTSTSIGRTTCHPDIPGRRRSFMKPMFGVSPFTPTPAWSILAPTVA